jgi:Zn-dependent alcohol dehydrogenase
MTVAAALLHRPASLYTRTASSGPKHSLHLTAAAARPQGTAFGGVKGRTELPALIEAYERGELPLDAFVTHTFSGVGAINDAVELMHDPSATNVLRPVIAL